MKPTIGRIVHYQAYGTPGGEYKPEPRAAIVTAVGEDGSTCGLAVLNPTGMFFNTGVPLDASAQPKGGTWHWPPREPAAAPDAGPLRLVADPPTPGG